MTEAIFAHALLDPDALLPPQLVDPQGRAAPKRFQVYRNNVTASLTRVLEAAFPTVRKLVGAEFFGAMAVAFLRAYPPRSPVLFLYGADFAAWLEQFPPVAHLGYLPDVARLDQAMRESYHAADSAPLSEAAFQRLLGADIASLRLTLAPSVRLVPSCWPLHAIWAANHDGGASPAPGAQDVLIFRPAFDPVPEVLPPGGVAFVEGLLRGRTLGESLDLGGNLDLAGMLALLIRGRAIVGVRA